MGQMDRCGTEDLGLVARLMYGYVLSSVAVLGPRDSSLVLLAGLVPQDVSLKVPFFCSVLFCYVVVWCGAVRCVAVLGV